MEEQVQAPAHEGLQEELTPDDLQGTVEVELPTEAAQASDEVTPEQLLEMSKEQQDSYQQKKRDAQSRINDLTKKYREEERKRIALEERLRLLETQQQQPPQSQQPTTNPAEQLKFLKQQKRQALADMDFVKADEVQDLIDNVVNTQRYQQQQQMERQRSIQSEIKSTLDKFVAETEWFNPTSPTHNKPMAAYAVYLEHDLAQKWKGDYASLLHHVRETVEREMNYTKPTGKQPVSFVGGVGNTSSPANRTVRLTEAQRLVAQKMFGDDPDALKKYAQGLVTAERGR